MTFLPVEGSLHWMMSRMTNEELSVSTAEIYEKVKNEFPNDNPCWLRKRINQYRGEIKRRREGK